MIEMFQIKFEYLLDEDKDTITYSKKIKGLVEALNRIKIVFAIDRYNIDQKLIKNLIKAYFGKVDYRDDSLRVDINYISHGNAVEGVGVAYMCMTTNCCGTFIFKRLSEML